MQGGRSRFEAEGMEFSSGHITFEAPGSSLSAGRRKKDWGSEHGLRREKGLDSNPLLPLVRYRTEPLPQALKLRFLTCKTGTTADPPHGVVVRSAIKHKKRSACASVNDKGTKRNNKKHNSRHSHQHTEGGLPGYGLRT